ncbi:MAG: CvpA family protein [Ectothiorhodospiraceae bacterium]|nr:CvpA family protein [Ectothiorhodospiraceae bacterium]
MIWVDIVIPGIIAISALFSLLRGFVREALSLLGWMAAFWVALTFAKDFAELLLTGISAPSIRVVVSFTILFVVTLVITALLNRLAGSLVTRTGLSGTDRMIGMIFGIARGVVVVSVLVLLAGMTTLAQDPWWQQSVLIDTFHKFAMWLRFTVAPELTGAAIISGN